MAILRRVAFALGCMVAIATAPAHAVTQTFIVDPDQDGIARLVIGGSGNGIEIERNMNYSFSLTVDVGTLSEAVIFDALTVDTVSRIRDGRQYIDYILYGNPLNYRQSVLPNGLAGAFQIPPDSTQPADPINETAFITESRAFYRGEINAQSTGPATFTFTFTASPAPEPATWALMIVGFGATGLAMRRRKISVASLPGGRG